MNAAVPATINAIKSSNGVLNDPCLLILEFGAATADRRRGLSDYLQCVPLTHHFLMLAASAAKGRVIGLYRQTLKSLPAIIAQYNLSVTTPRCPAISRSFAEPSLRCGS